MKITTKKLHQATKSWELDTAISTSFAMAWSEYLHELCHAAVFSFHIDEILTLGKAGQLTHAVQDRFGRYCPPHLYHSDISECRALAVEKYVLEELGWLGPDHTIIHNRDAIRNYRHKHEEICWPDIVEETSDNMHCFESNETHRRVAKYIKEPIAKRRANTVLFWLQKICET